MGINVTITDAQNSHTFNAIEISAPLVINPVIRETDVETIDGNIATYYSSTKQQVQLDFGYLSSDEYGILSGFQTRQYQNLKYPTITISGAPELNIVGMTAKIAVSGRQIVTACGLVRKTTVTFRESKQIQ